MRSAIVVKTQRFFRRIHLSEEEENKFKQKIISQVLIFCATADIHREIREKEVVLV